MMYYIPLIVLFVVCLALGRREPRAAAILNILVGSLLFLLRILPGGAGGGDWVLTTLFFLFGGLLLFAWNEIYA